MTSLITTNTLKGRQIKRGTSPKQPSSLKIVLPFDVDSVQQLTMPVTDDSQNVTGIAGIQSVFIDNSQNTQITTIEFNWGQTLVCPAFAQAMFPVLFTGANLDFKATSTGAVPVSLIFLNTREQAQQWSARATLGGTVSVTGSIVFTQPNVGSLTDASGSLAVAATSQVLLAANANRQFVMIRNPAYDVSQFNGAAGTGPEPVYLNFGTAAAVNGPTSWELLPGEQLPMMPMQTVQAINWTAASAGHKLICKWM